ncbi:malic enzyme-like NAD(P)-binding protein [Kiritimatiella glycovorans]|uniref:NADP-dependent malic enzyme n=1 Tax=Kiritimatiella glycovorans TaxID=1307763 RepID=A0A0G3EMN2_9BACT|nr:malic enzyme-like NAD(P)-binding protein [Kiritimatiella glycovorans]AKJ65364.1 NADP-dependent malic enzyme [Kiritimatiella glycovorans]
MKQDQNRCDSLEYHSEPRPGKLEVRSTKPCATQRDLSLAYSPHVAWPCREIEADPEAVYRYTGKANTVAVVSDGTAVLGLGRIGPHAGLPVMEGKAVLFKRFADIDALPICLSGVHRGDRTDPDRLIETVERLEPTFGGINLEDIGAPACFEVERQLKKTMPIPVFHDDQHGTAIICMAGIFNSLELTGRRIEETRFVVNGAGAAGVACIDLCISAGARRENVVLCDSKGVIYRGREEGMTPEKERLAAETDARTLADALKDADIFMGLSVADCVDRDMIRSMNDEPIVFAMANPDPEITPDAAWEAGAAVVGTGRSDYPNQVNNVLGFPGIFRGALDVRASAINEEMKRAAARALADLARAEVPGDVREELAAVYPEDAAAGMFDGDAPLGSRYVIPKPFDPRVVPAVARGVAEAAVRSGVARLPALDWDAYEREVTARLAGRG